MLESNSSPISAELFNNIGALYHRDAQMSSADQAKAREFYDRALVAVPDSEVVKTTIKYNQARLHEQSGSLSIEACETLYHNIIEEHPAYLDAVLRLGCISMARGRHSDARRAFSKIKDVDARSFLLLSACSLLDDVSVKTHLRDARKSFEEVLQKIDKNDSFALCNIGNIYLSLGQSDLKQKENYVRRALEFFDTALRVDGRNVFAATGVGICLAELGKYLEAKEVFTQVWNSSY